jgi:hypothetical protein
MSTSQDGDKLAGLSCGIVPSCLWRECSCPVQELPTILCIRYLKCHRVWRLRNVERNERFVAPALGQMERETWRVVPSRRGGLQQIIIRRTNGEWSGSWRDFTFPGACNHSGSGGAMCVFIFNALSDRKCGNSRLYSMLGVWGVEVEWVSQLGS